MHNIETLDKLLKNELSATATYQQALAKLREDVGLGKAAVIKALQEGEKSGAADYKQTLQDTELFADTRSLMEAKRFPAQQSHIDALERLLDVETA